MKKINMSAEDYLEAILITTNQFGACRVTDIAAQLGVSKPSTSIALNRLETEGYIRREDWRILLTPQGRELAQQVYERHLFFANWFQSIGVTPEIAREDACLIEHVLSAETYEKIRSYISCEHGAPAEALAPSTKD